MDGFKAFIGFALLGLVFWGAYLAISWVGDLWDGFIDSQYENELSIESSYPGISVSDIEIQWHGENELRWITKNGVFQRNLPEVAGKNNFRIFVQKQLIATFPTTKERASRKWNYKLTLRKDGSDLRMQFSWEPFFYHDDSFRSPPYHKTITIPANEIPVRTLPKDTNRAPGDSGSTVDWETKNSVLRRKN